MACAKSCHVAKLSAWDKQTGFRKVQLRNFMGLPIYHLLMPPSLRTVRQTFPSIRLYQNLNLSHLNLGGRSGPKNAVDGALRDGLLTVMEWPCSRGISSPFLAI